MTTQLNIAIDAEGGDNAPYSVYEALKYIVQHEKNIIFHVFCYEQHEEMFTKLGLKVTSCIKQDNPNTANTTMIAALQTVKNNTTQACISAGNTIFYLIEAIKNVHKLPFIRRPALITAIPAKPHDKVLVDIGANLQASAMEMVMFGVMGRVYAKHILGRDCPNVSFLNIGSEQIKGPLYIREARALFESVTEQMHEHTKVDFIEGDEIFHKNTDVIIMDGFTGNILLKFAEGMSKFLFKSMKETAKKSVLNMLYGFFAKKLLSDMKTLDPQNHNSAILMGLEGLVVKAHGNSNAKAFTSTILYTIKMCRMHKEMQQELNEYGEKLSQLKI